MQLTGKKKPFTGAKKVVIKNKKIMNGDMQSDKTDINGTTGLPPPNDIKGVTGMPAPNIDTPVVMKIPSVFVKSDNKENQDSSVNSVNSVHNDPAAMGTLMADAVIQQIPQISPKKSNEPVHSQWSDDKNNSGWGDEEVDDTTHDVEINTDDDNMPELVDDENKDVEMDKSLLINGVTYDELKTLPYNKQNQLAQCNYCLKFYKKENPHKMITTDFSDSETICFHCIFWMNYDVDVRATVDGVYGMTILEYIMECKDDHDKTTCTKNSDAGGCFLCDYLNNVPLVNVLGAESLFDDTPEQIHDDDNSFLQSVDYSMTITI